MTRAEAIELLELAVLPLNTVCQPAADDAERTAIDLRQGRPAAPLRAWARARIRRLRQVREIYSESAFRGAVFVPAVLLRIDEAPAAPEGSVK